MKRILLLAIACSSLLVGCKTSKISENDVSFSTPTPSIYVGESATLNWSVPELAKNATIEIVGLSSNLNYSGSTEVTPSSSTSYVLKVKVKNQVYSKTAKIEVKPKPLASISSLNASPQVVNYGESTTISWKADNLSDESIVVEGADVNISGPSGSFEFTPSESTSLTLRVIKNGTEINKKTIDITVKREVPAVGFSKGPDDGRFTIGGNSKRLMYGWPVPQSTSHFIIKVNDNYGCNRPGFTGANKYYLTGTQKIKGSKQSLNFEIEYFLDGVQVIQRLIPVDKNFNPVQLNQSGQYYRIEYEIYNTTNEPKTVGLIALTDLMLDNNDAAQVMVNGKLVDKETEYAGTSIADQYLVYFKTGDAGQLMSEMVLNHGATKPDKLYVGNWRTLHSVVWDVTQGTDKYGDSGILLKWGEKPLAKDEQRTYSYYYGLPNGGQISMIPVIKDLKTDYVEVFFAKGSSTLDKAAKSRIDSVLTANKAEVAGVLVSGYTDAQGGDDLNLRLSERRVNAVIAYLRTKGIAASVFIPKYYGESAATQTEETEKNGNLADRRCTITIYSAKKSDI